MALKESFIPAFSVSREKIGNKPAVLSTSEESVGGAKQGDGWLAFPRYVVGIWDLELLGASYGCVGKFGNGVFRHHRSGAG